MIKNQKSIDFLNYHIFENAGKHKEKPEIELMKWTKKREEGVEIVYSISFLDYYKTGDCDDYTNYFLAHSRGKIGVIYFINKNGYAFHIAPIKNNLIFDVWKSQTPIKIEDVKKIYKTKAVVYFYQGEKMEIEGIQIETTEEELIEFIQAMEDSETSINGLWSKLKGGVKKARSLYNGLKNSPLGALIPPQVRTIDSLLSYATENTKLLSKMNLSGKTVIGIANGIKAKYYALGYKEAMKKIRKQM